MRHSFLVLAAAAVALARPLNAQNQTLEIVRLAEGVHAAIRSEFRMDPIESNSLVVIGPDDVMVVDTGRTPHTARRIIGEIRKLTDRPVRLVVNSHWHDDHVFGNQAFEEAFPGVHFIAHRQTRLEMISRSIPSLKDYGLEYWSKMAERFEAQLAKGTRPDGSPLSEAQKTRLLDQARMVRDFLPKIEGQRIVLPTMEIESTVTIHQGKREIRLIHAGSGNTPGDVAVYLPQEKILATGDLLVHPVPFAYGSDIPAWVATLKTLRALDVDVIVPGHGPVMRDPQYLDLVIGLFQSLVDQVTAAKKAGLSLDETRKKLDVEPYRARMTGDDGFRRATFADSIVREAVERIYKAIAPAR